MRRAEITCGGTLGAQLARSVKEFREKFVIVTVPTDWEVDVEVSWDGATFTKFGSTLTTDSVVAIAEEVTVGATTGLTFLVPLVSIRLNVQARPVLYEEGDDIPSAFVTGYLDTGYTQ